MTHHVPENSRSAATAGERPAKKRWASPVLSRIATNEAENTANPSGSDGVLSMGS